MADITTRETSGGGATVKGSPLTNAEVDTNFINLQTDKIELTDLSVGAEGTPSGNGDVSYNNTTGVITYTPPSDIGGAVTFSAKAGEALAKGDVVYVSGVSGNEPVVSKADADDANKMPAYGLAEDSASLNAAVNVVTFGTLYDIDTSSFAAGDTVYVSTTAGAITTTAPTGESSLLQNIGTVIRSHASAGSIKVGGAGRTNATPNLDEGNVFIGNSSNQAEARALTGDDISGGTITSFASTGIDDNATSTAMTIASSGETTFTGDVVISEATPAITLDDADNADGELKIVQSTGSSFYRTRGVSGYGAHVFQRNNGTDILKIFQTSTNGDVLFYDDDGSTEGMRWDASANRLGIGESVPDEELHIKASNPTIKLEDGDGTDQDFRIFENNGQASLIAQNGTSFGNIIFRRDDGTDVYSILNLTADGDVIFYDDDGATSGLTWDASASKLTNFTSTGIDDNATSTAITIDSSENTTFAGTITSGDITISEGTPLLRLQDSDGTNQYTEIGNVGSTGRIGARNDTVDGIFLVGGFGGGVFTEWARWNTSGNLIQRNALIVEGSFTSLGIDDNATSTAITIDSSENSTFSGNIIVNKANSAIQLTTTTSNAYLDQNTSGATLNLRTRSSAGTLNNWLTVYEDADVNFAGNVGIGTTDPSTLLELAANNNSGAENNTLRFTDTSTTTVTDQALGKIEFKTNDASGDGALVRAYIGSFASDATPSTYLSFATNLGGAGTVAEERLRINASGRIIATTGTSSSAPIITGTAAQGQEAGIKIHREGSTRTGLSLFTEVSGVETDVIYCDSDANVGIGTSSPDANLEIRKDNASGLGAVLSLTNSNSSGLTGNSVAIGLSAQSHLAIDSASYRGAIIRSETTASGNAHSLIFETSDTSLAPAERVRIDHDGNLLVGTTTDPSSSGSGSGFIATSFGRNQLRLAHTDNTGTSKRLLGFYGGTAGNVVGDVTASNTATAYNTSSDQRLKENIVDAPAGNIDDIRVRSFDWKADGSHQTYGMVAQELVDVAPEAVTQGETDDDMWQVDYSKLVPMMIKEIQDLRARVAQLEGA